MSDRLVVGCGYLGGRVAALWRAQGHHVHVTTRSRTQAGACVHQALDPVVCDVLDPASLRKLPAAECTLYCVGWDRAGGRPMREVYVDGLRNVLRALPPGGRLIHVSSTSVYGQAGGEWVGISGRARSLAGTGVRQPSARRGLRQRVPRASLAARSS